MKNLFGVMPGAVYGWPKNVLHFKGIDESILDINGGGPPAPGDRGRDRRHGRGRPDHGHAAAAGVILIGRNLVAVDATAARLMGLRPERVPPRRGERVSRQRRCNCDPDARRAPRAIHRALRGAAGLRSASGMSRAHFLQAVLTSTNPWGLRIASSGRSLAVKAELAGNSATRKRGLLGRESLDAGHALVIAPCQGVHTFGMRFSLDVVGVARDGTVVTLRRDVPARRIVLAWRAFAIVELAAGVCAAAGLLPGDRLEAISLATLPRY